MLKVIIDFDGTLTAEETQVEALAHKSLHTLATEIIERPYSELSEQYADARRRLLEEPHRYGWFVNGLRASYCDEGAFILNTSTLQEMLTSNPIYRARVESCYPQAEYDPVMDCTNHLFHRHTAELPPAFRPEASPVLQALLDHPECTPVVLTNSLGDKVRRHLAYLNMDEIVVLGDTRQYDMQPDWRPAFSNTSHDATQSWPVLPEYIVDLRRPAYYNALLTAQADGSRLAVVADTFSLPGALPLMMGIPFFLLKTPYTPEWCIQAVQSHPLGCLLPNLGALIDLLPFDQ